MDGFRLTLLQQNVQNTITEGVQIVHSCGDHRIVVSSLECTKDEVHVYDSVYEEVDDDTRTVIQNLFGPEKVCISMVEMQSKEGLMIAACLPLPWPQV